MLPYYVVSVDKYGRW